MHPVLPRYLLAVLSGRTFSEKISQTASRRDRGDRSLSG